MKNLIRVIITLIVTITLGCGSSRTDPTFSVGGTGQGTVLEVAADPAALRSVQGRFAPEIQQFQVTPFSRNLQAVGQQTIARNGIARFNVVPGDYVVRMVGLSDTGSPLGYFDRVVTVPAGRVIIPTLFPDTNPPPINFPNFGDPSRLAIIGPKENRQARVPFDVTVQAYNAFGFPVGKVVQDVNLTSSAPGLIPVTPQNTGPNGQLVFQGVTFQNAILGGTFLEASATDLRTGRAFYIVFPPTEGSPVAVDDTYQALGNATLNVDATQGLLSNDTPSGTTITDFQNPSVQGGAVQINADGSFSYTPPTEFRDQSDTFTYSLGDSQATVTIEIGGLGLFVDNTASTGGDGSQTEPYNSLNTAITNAQSGDIIFVFRGDGTNTNLAGAVSLPAGVELTGEGVGLTGPGGQAIVAAAGFPVLQGPITLDNNCSTSGLRVDTSGGKSFVANGVTNPTISNNQINNSDEIDIDDCTGTVTVEANQFSNHNGNDMIGMAYDGANATLNVRNNILMAAGATNLGDGIDLDVDGTSIITGSISGNRVDGVDPGLSFAEGLELEARGTSQVTLTVTDNITDRCNDSFEIVCRGDSNFSLTFTGNQADSDRTRSTEIDVTQNGTFRLDARDNTFNAVNTADLDIEVRGTGTSNALIGLRNNTFNGTGVVDLRTSNNGDLCAVLEGNSVLTTLILDQFGGTFRVEALAGVSAANNNATVDTMGTGVMSVPVGTCGI